MVFNLVIKRPRWSTKQQQSMAHILHINTAKFPKDLFSFVLYTNMAAMTSGENHLFLSQPVSKKLISGTRNGKG